MKTTVTAITKTTQTTQNAYLTVRLAEAEDLLRKAQQALNKAPRFNVAPGYTSYSLASEIDKYLQWS